MLASCWANVVDGGPAARQHWLIAGETSTQYDKHYYNIIIMIIDVFKII